MEKRREDIEAAHIALPEDERGQVMGGRCAVSPASTRLGFLRCFGHIGLLYMRSPLGGESLRMRYR
jgi:hypothetical protein